MTHLCKLVEYTTVFQSIEQNLHMKHSKTLAELALKSSMHGKYLNVDSHSNPLSERIENLLLISY